MPKLWSLADGTTSWLCVLCCVCVVPVVCVACLFGASQDEEITELQEQLATLTTQNKRQAAELTSVKQEHSSVASSEATLRQTIISLEEVRGGG